MHPSSSDEQALLEYLRERDVACPLCGYNLRALASPRCPECGRDLRLSVGLTEPYLRAWLALAAATFAGAGVGVLFVLVMIREGWPGREDLIIKVVMVYFEANIAFTVPVLMFRRRFIRWSRAQQWVLASLLIILTLIGMFGFFVGIR